MNPAHEFSSRIQLTNSAHQFSSRIQLTNTAHEFSSWIQDPHSAFSAWIQKANLVIHNTQFRICIQHCRFKFRIQDSAHWFGILVQQMDSSPSFSALDHGCKLRIRIQATRSAQRIQQSQSGFRARIVNAGSECVFRIHRSDLECWFRPRVQTTDSPCKQ